MKNRDYILPADKATFTIAEASKRVGATIQTLLLYEKQGFVEPVRKSRSRMYREADIRLLRCIGEMAHLEKISLSAVKKLLQYAPCFEIRRCPEHLRHDCPASRRPMSGATQNTNKISLALFAAPPIQEEGL